MAIVGDLKIRNSACFLVIMPIFTPTSTKVCRILLNGEGGRVYFSISWNQKAF